MNTVNFHQIAVVQSIPERDLHTGRKIKEDIDLYNLAYRRNLKIDLFDAPNKSDFLKIMIILKYKAIYENIFPILHIEAHGSFDKQGIILSSNEFISWGDLKPYLINLNIATRFNLLVVFSLCHGAEFVSQLNPADRAPCWGLVGPKKALSAPELLGNFSAFYKEIFESGSAAEAVKKLNASSLKGEINYYFTTSTRFFFIVYQNYLNKQCNDKSYEYRARTMRKK
jgi:hypothetical protein